jgi:hypothetical protein
MIKKGVASEVVRLIAPHVKHGHPLVVTNIGYILAALLQAEQQLIHHQQKQQQQQSNGSKEKQQRQQQQQQLAPILATVLELVEVQKFVTEWGPNLKYNPGEFYQV